MHAIHRRAALLAAAGLALPSCARAQEGATTQSPTPRETQGPFYPVETNIERDADLTRLAGRNARAAGQIIEVRGRVIDSSGQPHANARIELWQANAVGRYAHPRDQSAAPLDPNFQGYALLQTGADGAFAITSVKPGAYRSGGALRTPHLHWKVAANRTQLTTQMYFPGEATNGVDNLMRAMGERACALIAEPDEAREPDALAFHWTIVLR